MIVAPFFYLQGSSVNCLWVLLLGRWLTLLVWGKTLVYDAYLIAEFPNWITDWDIPRTSCAIFRLLFNQMQQENYSIATNVVNYVVSALRVLQLLLMPWNITFSSRSLRVNSSSITTNEGIGLYVLWLWRALLLSATRNALIAEILE